MELVESALERCFHAGGGAGAVMTGMTLEKSGKNLNLPDFPDPTKRFIPAIFPPFQVRNFAVLPTRYRPNDGHKQQK